MVAHCPLPSCLAGTKRMTYMQLGQTDMMVSTVGIGGCVVGGEYPDKGDLEEIMKVSFNWEL